jgi:hypothetical protein
VIASKKTFWVYSLKCSTLITVSATKEKSEMWPTIMSNFSFNRHKT